VRKGKPQVPPQPTTAAPLRWRSQHTNGSHPLLMSMERSDFFMDQTAFGHGAFCFRYGAYARSSASFWEFTASINDPTAAFCKSAAAFCKSAAALRPQLLSRVEV